MVTTQLIKYLIENDTFSHNQFGFRPGLSTENAFNKILSSIYTAVEENKNFRINPTVSILNSGYQPMVHGLLVAVKIFRWAAGKNGLLFIFNEYRELKK